MDIWFIFYKKIMLASFVIIKKNYVNRIIFFINKFYSFINLLIELINK
jgi:hypothetical protein